jgi:hypothetical protein
MLELNSIISNAQDSRVFIRGLHKISVKSPMQKKKHETEITTEFGSN